MTDVPLQKRLREHFMNRRGGNERDIPRAVYMNAAQAQLLVLHAAWLRTNGQFGMRLVESSAMRHVKFRNLDGHSFEGVKIYKPHFYWSNLRNASFVNAELPMAIFEGCDLEGADFRGAHLKLVEFIDCVDLDKAIFDPGVHLSKGKIRKRVLDYPGAKNDIPCLKGVPRAPALESDD